jgi:hypothetical protein
MPRRPKPIIVPAIKLTIELIPQPLAKKNLRNRLKPHCWRDISQFFCSGGRCEVCGAEGKLHCHECWDYEGEAHVQRLVGFKALCQACHAIKHFSAYVVWQGDGTSACIENPFYKPDPFRVQASIDHFCKVNRVKEPVFWQHLRKASATQQERSRHEWTQDFGSWQPVAGSV